MGRGFFPLDEALGIGSGGWTPRVQEWIVRLGTCVASFAKAAELVKDGWGVAVSEATVRRQTERAGEAAARLQDEEAEALDRELPEGKGAAERLQVSVDGSYVQVVGGEWVEVKALAIGEVKSNGEEVGVENLTYFARRAEAERFRHLAMGETYRRGVWEAAEVAGVSDGADWIQGFYDYHCPQAVRILDFCHAVERFGKLGEVLYGSESEAARQWTAEQAQRLIEKGGEQVVSELAELVDGHPQRAQMEEDLNYLLKRQDMMDYATFRQQGWPIGSGMVESAHKVVVQVRLKGAGMRWAEQHINPMLALRTVECNHQWQEQWPRIVQRWQKLERAERQERRKKSKGKSRETAAVQTTPPQEDQGKTRGKSKPAPTIHQPAEQNPPTSSQPRRPAPDHPWRRMPIGRALFYPNPASEKN